jgi:hypothetical protein
MRYGRRPRPSRCSPRCAEEGELLCSLYLADTAGRSLTCRCERVSSAHPYAEAGIFIRDQQCCERYVAEHWYPPSGWARSPNICGGLRSGTDVASSTDQPILVPGGDQLDCPDKCRALPMGASRTPTVAPRSGGTSGLLCYLHDPGAFPAIYAGFAPGSLAGSPLAAPRRHRAGPGRAGPQHQGQGDGGVHYGSVRARRHPAMDKARRACVRASASGACAAARRS